jgi:PKD repeat protein
MINKDPGLKTLSTIFEIVRMKGLLVLFFSLFSIILQSQPAYIVDSVYVPNTPVSKVRASYNGEVWFLDSNPSQQFYQLNREGRLQNRSNDFQTQLESGISDFVCLDTNEIVVGTEDNFAFYYKHGIFVPIGVNNGLQPNENHISSLFLYHNVIKQFGDTLVNDLVFGISTNGKAYRSDTILGHYTESDGSYYRYDNKKYLSKNDPFFFGLPRPNGTTPSYCDRGGGIWEYGEFDTIEFGKLLCGNLNFYSGWSMGSILYAWFGFEKGYVTKTSYINDYTRYLTSQAIHAIVDIDDYFVLIAADSGLYYSNTFEDPHKIDLGIGNFTANDIEVSNGNIFVATNKGLLHLISANCQKYKAGFDQDKQYADAQEEEEIKFEPVLYGGTNSCIWDFGDSASSTLKFPAHHYTSPGNYKVRLITSNKFCMDTAYSIAVIYPGSVICSSEYQQYYEFPGNENSYISESINISDLDGDTHSDIFLPPLQLIKLTQGNDPSIEIKELDPEIIVNGTPFSYWVINSISGDLNNDGLNDIIAGTRIFINDGNFNFKVILYDSLEVFTQYPVHCLLDYNNDGKLDIALGRENELSIYLNKGSFQFQKIHHSLNTTGSISGIKWFDIDNDDDNDLFISGISSHNIFINENGKYIEKDFGALSQLLIDNLFTGDINNDRRLDFYIRSNYENRLFLGSELVPEEYKDTWLTNENDKLNYSSQFSVSGANWDDFDNNGYVDCLKNTLMNKSSRIFMNYGNMIFRNDPNNPFTFPSSRYVATNAAADLSGDGKIDIIFGNTDFYDAKDFIFLNRTTSENHWVKFNCFGTRSNINAIGAKVFVKSKNTGQSHWQYRIIESGHSNNAQNGYEVHFGLGDAEIVDTLEILWPSGKHSFYANLEVDKTYSIVETYIRYDGDTAVCENTRPLLQMPKVNDVNYHWLLNGNPIDPDGNFHMVSQPGVYKCVIQYPWFSDTTSAINITFKEVSPSFIQFEHDSIFCPEDSVLITSLAYSDASYRWLINGVCDTSLIQSHIYISDTLSVRQILINNIHCSDTSNTLIPRHYPTPVIQFEDTIDICIGDSAEIAIDSTFSRYLWSNGDSTFATWLYTDHSLSVKVWNDHNCLSEDTVPFSTKPLPDLNLGEDLIIDIGDTYYSNNCSLEPYMYFWNDSSESCDRVFNGSKLNIGKHEFILKVINQYNCLSVDTLVIEVILNKEDTGLSNEDLVVFPNPTHGDIRLYINGKLMGENTSVEIINSNGKITKKQYYNINAPMVINVPVANFTDQVMFIRVSNNNHSEMQKIILLK